MSGETESDMKIGGNIMKRKWLGIVNISAVNKRTNLTYAAFSGLSSSLR